MALVVSGFELIYGVEFLTVEIDCATNTPSVLQMQYPKFNVADLISGTPDWIPVPDGDFWVFAYGSLMWNPGFQFDDSSPATLHGYHRRLCLWSINYRGTEQQPGLVLGLDRGGSCPGYAYRVMQQHRDQTVEYLCDRELISGAYIARLCPLKLADGRRVSALSFVCRTDHPHFSPKLPIEDTVKVVSLARGKRGCNREYVENTVAHLDQMNIRNTELHKVVDRLGGL